LTAIYAFRVLERFSLVTAEPPKTVKILEETLEQVNHDILTEGQKAFPKRTFIFGEGPIGARLLFIGESPGPPDALSGLPFQGPVGDMMNRIIGGISLTREECYLTNVVKYISQGKNLTPDIIEFFLPFLHREILAVEPQIIVTLGAMPAQVLLGTEEAISKIRGLFYEFQGIPLMATFNPAYLLRDPSRKREVWEDMKKVRDLLK
jgi:uracil-DNA glycosylase family 4